MKYPTKAEILKVVQDQYEYDDEVEVGDDPDEDVDMMPSDFFPGTGGAWVRTYHWVRFTEVPGYENIDEEAE